MDMKRLSAVCSMIAVILCFLYPGLFVSTAGAVHEEEVTETAHPAKDELPGEVPFDRPVEEIKAFLAPMNEMDLYPCSDCHDESWEANPERRELDDPHSEIPGEFVNHDSENRWCLDCHSLNKRDKLELLNGQLVDYDEYYKVCEQCHKRVYREWKMGVHGKRTGYFAGDGEIEWMHCTQCHNPHNPPFQFIKPEPAPRSPLNIRATSEGGQEAPAEKH